MIDVSKKSRMEILREKKEAELREARKKESEWNRKKEKETKCLIGGAFLKHFPEACLFEAGEWDRIAGAVVTSKEFQGTVQAIKKEDAGVMKKYSMTAKPEITEKEEDFLDDEDSDTEE